MINGLLGRLRSLQSDGSETIPKGNFSSTRYHPFFPIQREEDNVYFVSWILQLLRRIRPSLDRSNLALLDLIIRDGDECITQYRNRYGEHSYNFYRPDHWFPNGRFLSRSVKFQPTDDSDDTAIAMKAKAHDQTYARVVKETFIHQSNGLRGRWIKRCPKSYRSLKAYNTWIGSEGMFVEFDLVVIANILTFNAHYDLGRCEQDTESILFIERCLETGDWWKRSWSVSSWYPQPSVILYSLADLLETGYYPELERHRSSLSSHCHDALERSKMSMEELEGSTDMHDLLYTVAYHKLNHGRDKINVLNSLDSLIADSATFSFGVIPLTNPWNGLFAQWLGGFRLFQLHYECEAQCVAVALEWAVMSQASAH